MWRGVACVAVVLVLVLVLVLVSPPSRQGCPHRHRLLPYPYPFIFFLLAYRAGYHSLTGWRPVRAPGCITPAQWSVVEIA